jgi:tripartite-type tricarboxylate transporter receptor subunit TctC
LRSRKGNDKIDEKPGGSMIGNISRAAVRIAALAAGLVYCSEASAQDWPARPVTMIVPYAPGGNIDQAARVFGRELSEKLGQQFIVESKGGAGGAIGAVAVAKSKPDGYTLLVTANGPAVLNKMLYASLPYDPDADFTPVSLISDVPLVFIVNPASPVRDLKDFVAQAKQKKDAVTIGHPGIGTGAHLAALWFASLAGINIVPVAYRGANPIVTAVLGGEIDVGLPSYIPQVQSVKTIAVTADRRVDFLPGVPTARENGFTDIVTGTFTGLAAPAGVPPEIVTKMNRILDAFLKTDAAKKQFAALGAQTLGGPPERLTERVKQEEALWGPIVKNANIKLQ